MSIEGGGLGGIGGGVGGGIAAGAGGGIGAGVSIGPALGGVGLGMSSGIETGGLTGAVPALAGPGILGEFRGFGGSGPVNEGPVGLSDLQTTVPWQANIDVISQAGEVAGRAWNLPAEPDVSSQIEDIAAKAWDLNVVTQAEEVLYQAQKPAIFSPVTLNHSVILNEVKDLSRMRVPNKQSLRFNDLELGDSSLITQNDNKAELVVFPQVEPMVLPFVLPNIAPKILEFPKAVASPASEPAVQTGPQTGTGVANEAEPVTAPQPVLQEQEVEEIVQEKVKTDTAEEELDKEKVVKLKKYLVDQPVLETVLSEAYQAYDKAEKEAEESGLGKKIFGAQLAKLLPGQHEANTGGAVKPYGFDGTIPARREAIVAKQEFRSKQELTAVILENRPVTIGENGEESRTEEVSVTFRDHVVKPPRVIEIVTERVVKKKKAVSIMPGQASAPIAIKQQVETKTEPSLEDYPVLAEVFPKEA